jgi:acyl-CoA reductase-like NAD-dependent aldehyde dehydrogenase
MDTNSICLTIDGRTRTADTTFPVIDPATGNPFAACPAAAAADLDEAVAAARRAFATWSQTPIEARSTLMRAAADMLAEHAEELAQLTTREQGKPLSAARKEMAAAIGSIRVAAALRPPVDTVQDDENALIQVIRKPLGVVGSITPWNHPILIACWHIGPALIAGDTVVIKPSSYTPFGTLRLVELLNSVLPAGVVNSVTGEGEIGRAMSSHDDIDKIVFTGSSPTGRNIMGTAAATLKRLTLELGGNDAAILLPDVDIEKCIDNIFLRSFGNSGQTCAALKRLYVHSSIHDAVVAELVARAGKAVVGPGNDARSQFGPIQNKAQYDYVLALAADTLARGGRFACGGTPAPGPGYFFPLSVAIDVHNGMRIVDEEQFGPLLPVVRYDDVEAAIAMANANANGLGGSIWTQDEALGARLAQRLECGTAWVNNHSQLSPAAPFGGAKQSGLGVEFGLYGLEEYMQLQAIHINRKGGAM